MIAHELEIPVGHASEGSPREFRPRVGLPVDALSSDINLENPMVCVIGPSLSAIEGGSVGAALRNHRHIRPLSQDAHTILHP